MGAVMGPVMEYMEVKMYCNMALTQPLHGASHEASESKCIVIYCIVKYVSVSVL